MRQIPVLNPDCQSYNMKWYNMIRVYNMSVTLKIRNSQPQFVCLSLEAVIIFVVFETNKKRRQRVGALKGLQQKHWKNGSILSHTL